MTTSLEAAILDYIAKNPGKKSKDIAAALSSDKATVNTLLYGQLRAQLHQDKAYCWFLKKADSQNLDARSTSMRDSLLARLCRYYLDCLNRDDTDGTSLFASSRFNLDYAELDVLPFDSEFRPGQEILKLASRAKRDRQARQVLAIGYPVRLVHIQTPRWQGYKVEPIFVFPVTSDRNDLKVDISEAPNLNFAALKAPGESTQNVLEEAAQLSEDLGLSDTNSETPDLDELTARLRDLRPEWNWIEPSDPRTLSRGPAISTLTEPGIYNRAIVFMAEASNFTKGLEAELVKLQEVPEAACGATVIGSWLSAEKSIENQPPVEKPLIEILPLNTEQRDAVRRALANPLTVVTGPPGTGKSQVVSSILINAAWQGQKVLFASKNNKAVDVVETRVNALAQKPLLLRLGGKAKTHASVVSYLSSLLTATCSSSDEMDYEEWCSKHRAICNEFEVLERALEKTYSLRNEVDQFEQEAESARELLGDIFGRCFEYDAVGSTAAAAEIKKLLKRADRTAQPFLVRLLWRCFSAKRYEALMLAVQRAGEVFRFLAVSIPVTPPSELTFNDWRTALELFEVRRCAAESVKRYFDALHGLNTSEALESVARRKAGLLEELTRMSKSLWNSWLKLLPKKLSQVERRSLNEYAAILQMMLDADEAGQKIDRAIYARYYDALSRVTSILSSWAVTSLSAKGRIPLEPGFFDLVVIDEASQCDIASALPLLFRAKRAVIIGDPKQLRHISRLMPKQDAMFLSKHGLLDSKASWGYSVNSLFDLASGLCRSEDVITLRDHHRSHADIIGFCNTQFYENQLRVATDYRNLRMIEADPAVRWIDVQGRASRPTQGGAINEIEARRVLVEIERLVVHQRYQGSIGVVSPFRAQVNRIRDLVSQNDLISARITADFLIETVHNFQGDERDVMIFSPVLSAGISDGAIAFLMRTPNLFNVAITRARSALIVVGDRRAVLASKVGYLAKFADYISLLDSRTSPKDSIHYPDSDEYPAVARPELVSDWEKVLYVKLRHAGIRTIPQYAAEKYLLDFALIDGERRLNIEVDGERYHRNWDGELCRLDQLRNQRLNELGWDVMRFWVYQVRDDMPGCIRRVQKWLIDR